MIKQRNIQQQVALLTLLPLLILTICLEFFLLYGRFTDLDQSLVERGKLIASQMAVSSEYGVFANNQPFLKTIANGVLREPDVRGLVILNAASDVLLNVGLDSVVMSGFAHTTKNGVISPAKFTRSSQVEKPLNTYCVDSTHPIQSNSESVWIYQTILLTNVPIDDLDTSISVHPIGAVIVEMSKLNTEARKRQMLGFSLAATSLFLLIALVLVYWASRSITTPTRLLSTSVKQIEQGDLETLITFKTKISELTTLSTGLNNMTVQLHQDREVLQQRVEVATQALREKADEAERASHDKSRFLAVASHDLRQPLHALGLYVAELHRQLASTEQQPLVEQVANSVDALATLLNALLDISKLDAGVVIPQMQSCNLDAIIARISNDCLMLAATKNVRLVIHPCLGYVTSDPVLLERILMNLLSNAIRYSYPNGCVMIVCRKRGSQLRVEVRDSGIGISQLDQANIFREFFQIAKPQLDSNKGLGLGLAIVDRLVKLLGHRIELRSAPNKGSLFALQLEVSGLTADKNDFLDKNEPLIAPLSIGFDSLPLYGKNILVVDDDVFVLDSTANILRAWGGNVSTATGLPEIQPLLKQATRWDLIITDYELAIDETGLDVISSVNFQAGHNVPSIVISGNTSNELLQVVNTAGHHLLHKPVKPAKLRSLVMYLLNDSNALG